MQETFSTDGWYSKYQRLVLGISSVGTDATKRWYCKYQMERQVWYYYNLTINMEYIFSLRVGEEIKSPLVFRTKELF